MKTIAITNWNCIISPLFDASCSLLVVKPDGTRKQIDIKKLSLFDKAELCSTEGVDVLICGAISIMGSTILSNKGIEVYSWIRGQVEDVICAYSNNIDLAKYYSMPGFRHGNCRKRRRCRNSSKGESKELL